MQAPPRPGPRPSTPPRSAGYPVRPRNDVAQYDDLVDEWERPDGAFAALRWLARSRSELIPPGTGTAVLVDVGCGGGLLAEHVRGYRHVGVDLVPSGLRIARRNGIMPVRGDAGRLPLRDGCAEVVVAGEIFEHVRDLPAAVAECARVLRRGGLLVADTIASGLRARLEMVVVGERVPGGPPRRIHDPNLFVDPRRLSALFAAHGVRLRFRGLRPSIPGYLRFALGLGTDVSMVPTRGLRSLYQAVGRKAS